MHIQNKNTYTHGHTYRQTQRHIGIQTDKKQTHEHTDNKNGHINIKTEKHMDSKNKYEYRHTHRHINQQTENTQIHAHTEKHAERQTQTQTDRQINRHIHIHKCQTITLVVFIQFL